MPPRRGAPRRSSRSASTAQRENPQSLEVEDEIISPEDLDTSHQPINVLIAGPAGHGKTTLTAFAKPGHTYIISTETGGPISAKRAGASAKVFQSQSWKRVVASKKWCDENLDEGDWVILDSLTKMQVLMIRWILASVHDDSPARDLDIPAIQDHQKWQNYFKRFVDQLIDAKYNVVFICGQMMKTDSEGDDIILPMIDGKDYAICDYVTAQTSLNIYYAVTEKYDPDGLPADYEGKVRRALFVPSGPIVFPKDRFGLGEWRDVLDGEYPFGEWVKEIEAFLSSEAVEDEAPAATPIGKARSSRSRG